MPVIQYERIIKLVVDKYFNSITDPDEIRMYLNKIKNGELELIHDRKNMEGDYE